MQVTEQQAASTRRLIVEGVKCVREFMTRVCGCPVPDRPTPLSPERKDFAVQLLTEELSEFVVARTLADEADALVDLAYVAMGRLVEAGLCDSVGDLHAVVAYCRPPETRDFFLSGSRFSPRQKWTWANELRNEIALFASARALDEEAAALVDAAGAALDALWVLGVDCAAAFAEVHRANMDKVPGVKPERGGAHDAVKPPGWRPPDWASLLGCAHLADSATPGRHLREVPCQKCGQYYTEDGDTVMAAGVDHAVQGGAVCFTKYDAGKDCRPELVPAPFLWELAKLFARGAKKYAPENWREGRDAPRYVGALERHVLAWRMGERDDPETGVHHLVCAAWNACVLFVTEVERPESLRRGPDSETRYEP
jgi:predicted HAD superfamily Cof-like phosphohydrolase